MENHITKAAVIIDLQNRGYNRDFILNKEFLLCLQDRELIAPDDFEITGTYEFEDQSEHHNNALIYAISAINNDLKGILMTSYQAFEKGLSIHLWSKLAGNFNNK